MWIALKKRLIINVENVASVAYFWVSGKCMRHYLIILFFLFTSQSFCQYGTDTMITKYSIDSLRITINNFRQINKFQEFEIRLLTELKQIDTIHSSKDSLILNFISKTGQLLRVQRQLYKPNCMTDSSNTYYNKMGLIEYYQNWSCSCGSMDLVDINDNFFCYRNSFHRYEYDNKNRVIKYVIHISTPQTIRWTFSYDDTGNTSKMWKRIKDYEFWEWLHLPLTLGLAIPGADGTCVLGRSAWPGSSLATRLRRRGVCK